MKKEEAQQKFNELFDSDQSKIEAFNKIAEKYYYSNFGSTSKADFDVLMFSLYLERILEKDQKNFNAYSDYTLSKALGITQSKVSSLKVKKELIYPYEKFEWRDSFLAVSENAVYEDGKIKLYVPDKNLYLEIKNAIETSGGFVEVQLTPNLLQVRLAYFLDLILLVDEDSARERHREAIQKKIAEEMKDEAFLKKESFGKALLHQAPDMIFDIIEKCIPVFGGAVSVIAKNIYNAVKVSRGK